jgi:hypothetical protein
VSPHLQQLSEIFSYSTASFFGTPLRASALDPQRLSPVYALVHVFSDLLPEPDVPVCLELPFSPWLMVALPEAFPEL